MSWWDNMYNQSFAGSYQNAARQRAWLRDPNNEMAAANDGDWAMRYDDAMKAQQGQAVAGGIVTGLTGATTLLSNAFKDAQIRDTSAIENQYRDLANFGNLNYNNYAQLANDYANTPYAPTVRADEIRGMNTGQKIGSIGTSALSGAMTGLQIGGPWGALAGLVIGGGVGTLGVLEGDNRAEAKANYLGNMNLASAEISGVNKAAAHERIGDNIHRQNAINAVAKGGPIKRQQSIKEYADRVLGHKVLQGEKRQSSVQRIMTNGGCVYRVKVK